MHNYLYLLETFIVKIMTLESFESSSVENKYYLMFVQIYMLIFVSAKLRKNKNKEVFKESCHEKSQPILVEARKSTLKLLWYHSFEWVISPGFS